MGFILSINGADFQPYELSVPRPPSTPPAPATEKVAAIDNQVPHRFYEVVHHPQSRHYKEQIEIFTRTQKKALLAKDLMQSPVVTVSREDTTQRASDLMVKYGFQHLPVLNESQRICGMLSDRDFLALSSADRNQKIEQIMSREVIAATAETPLVEIAQVLCHHQIHCLPIVEEDFTIVGIISTTDILRAVMKRADFHLWA